MKVCYIFRQKERKEYSIEAVFDTIAKNTDNTFEISKWYKPVSWVRSIKELIKLRKEKFDCYHITGEVYYLWIFLPFRRTIMTVHDIGMYKNHPWSLKRWLFVFLGIYLPSLFHKKIVCISELTRNDLVSFLHIKESKLITIENPLTIEIQPTFKQFNKGKPIIMQIGTGDHKNLDNLILAVKGLDCQIDIIGNPSTKLIELLNTCNIDYCISTNISNEELIDHYNHCDILYFVSRSEGFGLPILEAQAAGKPVITSEEEPMKSVAGEGALFAYPEDYYRIKENIMLIIENDNLRYNLIKSGLKNIKRFEPKRISMEYQKLYTALFSYAR